jgi:hypothetical protein
MLGRMIAMQDFLAGRPQVIIDAIGGTIDNFLDKFSGFCNTSQNQNIAPSGSGLCISTWLEGTGSSPPSRSISG